MLVLEEESDSRRDVLRQRRVNDKHYIYDKVFSEESTQVSVCTANLGELPGVIGIGSSDDKHIDFERRRLLSDIVTSIFILKYCLQI